MSNALGLIEVSGYVAAIGAADAALKAANVNLVDLEKVKAGITTVKLVGDVAAVKASVEAGSALADSLGKLRASHVIPRLHEEVYKILPGLKLNDKLTENVENSIESIEEKKEKSKLTTKSTKQVEKILEEDKEVDNIEIQEDSTEEIKDIVMEGKVDFSSLKVEELRKLARSLNLPNMTNKQIKFAKKDILIKAISEFYKEGDK